VVKTVEFLKSRVRVDERRVEKGGKGPLRFWDHRIAIFDSEDMGGKGLLATEFVPKGTLIWTADLNQESSDILTLDEVLSFDTAAHRQQWADYTWAISGLFFGPRRDFPVEQAIALEASHYLNHSCQANVGFASDTSLVTIRDIEAGEMISNDYALTEHLIGFFPGFKCNCGAPNCRGQVTVNDWRIPELQVRYKGYFTSGVEALINAVTMDWSSLLQKTPMYQELRVGIEVRDHPIAEVGKGLFATTLIRKGEMVCVDLGLGRQISVADVLAVRDPRVRDFYVRFGYQTDRKEFTIPTVDPLGDEEPDAGFYMNHSCDPSTISFCNGKLYIAFRDIQPGEEITYDYATSETQFDRIPVCRCGAVRCRGAVKGQDWKISELQYKYPPNSWATHIMCEMFNRFIET